MCFLLIFVLQAQIINKIQNSIWYPTYYLEIMKGNRSLIQEAGSALYTQIPAEV